MAFMAPRLERRGRHAGQRRLSAARRSTCFPLASRIAPTRSRGCRRTSAAASLSAATRPAASYAALLGRRPARGAVRVACKPTHLAGCLPVSGVYRSAKAAAFRTPALPGNTADEAASPAAATAAGGLPAVPHDLGREGLPAPADPGRRVRRRPCVPRTFPCRPTCCRARTISTPASPAANAAAGRRASRARCIDRADLRPPPENQHEQQERDSPASAITVAATLALAGGAAFAQADKPLRIGFSMARPACCANATPSQLNTYELWR